MNKISTFILIFLTFSCSHIKEEKKSEKRQIEQEKLVDSESKKTIFDVVFRNINDLKQFEDFEMNSGTVIDYDKSEWEFAFLEIQHQNKHIVILEKIIETGEPKKNYQILDTIHINDLKETEFISIGSCQNKGKPDARILTIIDRADVGFEVEYYTKIKRAWKANLLTGKIEKISDIKGIVCTNDGYGI